MFVLLLDAAGSDENLVMFPPPAAGGEEVIEEAIAAARLGGHHSNRSGETHSVGARAGIRFARMKSLVDELKNPRSCFDRNAKVQPACCSSMFRWKSPR